MRTPRVPGDASALGRVLVDALLRASDGVFVTDAAGRIVLWNAAAEAILGYSAAEVQGRACCTTLRSRENETPPCSGLVRTPTTGCPPVIPTFDMNTVTKTGRAVSINVSVLSLDHRRCGARYMVHLFRDVTLGSELPEAYDGSNLTRREREVLELMSAGLSTVAMARRLSVSRATIRNHVQNILQKLGVHSRLEAVSTALGRNPAGAAAPQLARPRPITAAAVID